MMKKVYVTLLMFALVFAASAVYAGNQDGNSQGENSNSQGQDGNSQGENGNSQGDEGNGPVIPPSPPAPAYTLTVLFPGLSDVYIEVGQWKHLVSQPGEPDDFQDSSSGYPIGFGPYNEQDEVVIPLADLNFGITGEIVPGILEVYIWNFDENGDLAFRSDKLYLTWYGDHNLVADFTQEIKNYLNTPQQYTLTVICDNLDFAGHVQVRQEGKGNWFDFGSFYSGFCKVVSGIMLDNGSITQEIGAGPVTVQIIEGGMGYRQKTVDWDGKSNITVDFTNTPTTWINPPVVAPELEDVTASAQIVKDKNGAASTLYITVTETYSDMSTKAISGEFRVGNGNFGSDTFDVGTYQVFVKSQGRDKVAECYIVE